MKVAFKMMLNPGCKAEYKKRHDEIWPELKLLLKESGVQHYAIFLDEETNTLFAIQEKDEKNRIDINSHPVMQKWWDYMKDIMETNPDHSPVAIPLLQVFNLV